MQRRSWRAYTLVVELAGDVLGGGAGNVNPELREEGAGDEDESDVEDSVEGIGEDLLDAGGRGQVVGHAADGDVVHVGTLVNLLHTWR